MPALEYLSQNSLTNYPLRAGRSKALLNPIEDDWFCDILYVSKSHAINRVYISKIEKISNSFLKIYFSDFLSQLPIGDGVQIRDDEFTHHATSKTYPFAAATNTYFSVKIVLGQGLILKESFSQTYTADETELASSAVIPPQPHISSLTFEHYRQITDDGAPIQEYVHTYVFPDIPKIQLRYNIDFTSITAYKGQLDVLPGAGAGLYNNCETNEYVRSINNVPPNANGSFFINTSSCYSLNLLTPEEEVNLGSILDNYRLYDVYTAENEITTIDVVSSNHSLFLQNFCKPRCPPENIKAFAHYLNRITDAANELTSIAFRDTQTSGLGYIADNPRVFNVASGDFLQSTPFDSCALLSKGTKFIKYFHEFRKIEIYHAADNIQEYDIISVIDDDSVLLSRPPGISSTKLPFRITDVGTFSLMNCATAHSNIQADSYLKPYFKVKHTSFEARNELGQYVTYLSISIAVYNPSDRFKEIHIVFDAPDSDITQQGKFKVRRDGSTVQLTDALFELACKEYVLVDAIYFVPCGNSGGDLSISVFDVTEDSENPIKIGETYLIANVNGADCPGAAGKADKLRVLQPEIGYFTSNIAVDVNATNIELLSKNIPDWLDFPSTTSGGFLRLVGLGNVGEYTTSERYSIVYRTYGATTSSTISTIVLDYVALPEIISPLALTYSYNNPILIDKITTYSENSPVFSVRATNMQILSADYPEDNTEFRYALSGAPEGLIFNEITGTLSGQLANNVDVGSLFELRVSARNTAGQATNPQTIYMYVEATSPPVISFA